MKLSKRLNFVVPVDRGDGNIDYVHAAPIDEATFDKYFMTIGQAFAQLYSGGLGLFAGPRIAAKLIKRVAIASESWEGEDGVERGLFGAIRQRAVFIRPGSENVLLEEAVSSGMISAEDVSEVENALAFFIVASSMHKRSELPTILAVVSRIWDARTSSLNATEFLASLRTSTEVETSGAKAKPSPIPV